jgi:hypothetical protein
MTAALLTRHADWRLCLDVLVRERTHQPFAWGSNDCALFAADCVRAITGVDVAAHLRVYKDARGATVMLQAYGGLMALATQLLGAPAGIRNATAGDVVLVRMSKREALGILFDHDTLIGPGAQGITVASMSDALCAWRVG